MSLAHDFFCEFNFLVCIEFANKTLNSFKYLTIHFLTGIVAVVRIHHNVDKTVVLKLINFQDF